MRTCRDCGCDISNLHAGSKMCKACSTLDHGTFEQKCQDVPNFLDDKIEGIDYVTCKICGVRATDISKHIPFKHKITSEEYRNQFPDAKILCENSLNERSEKIKGDKNPAKKSWRKILSFQ